MSKPYNEKDFNRIPDPEHLFWQKFEQNSKSGETIRHYYKVLKEKLKTNPKILDLSALEPGDRRMVNSDLRYLSALLISTNFVQELEVLDFNYNQIGTKGFEKFAKIFSGQESPFAIKDLCLKDNLIGDDGAESVALLIKNHPSIKILDISKNRGMTILGISTILNSLKDNNTLENLSIGGEEVVGLEGLKKTLHILKMAVEEPAGNKSLKTCVIRYKNPETYRSTKKLETFTCDVEELREVELAPQESTPFKIYSEAAKALLRPTERERMKKGKISAAKEELSGPEKSADSAKKASAKYGMIDSDDFREKSDRLKKELKEKHPELDFYGKHKNAEPEVYIFNNLEAFGRFEKNPSSLAAHLPVKESSKREIIPTAKTKSAAPASAKSSFPAPTKADLITASTANPNNPSNFINTLPPLNITPDNSNEPKTSQTITIFAPSSSAAAPQTGNMPSNHNSHSNSATDTLSIPPESYSRESDIAVPIPQSSSAQVDLDKPASNPRRRSSDASLAQQQLTLLGQQSSQTSGHQQG